MEMRKADKMRGLRDDFLVRAQLTEHCCVWHEIQEDL